MKACCHSCLRSVAHKQDWAFCSNKARRLGTTSSKPTTTDASLSTTWTHGKRVPLSRKQSSFLELELMLIREFVINRFVYPKDERNRGTLCTKVPRILFTKLQAEIIEFGQNRTGGTRRRRIQTHERKSVAGGIYTPSVLLLTRSRRSFIQAGQLSQGISK